MLGTENDGLCSFKNAAVRVADLDRLVFVECGQYPVRALQYSGQRISCCLLVSQLFQGLSLLTQLV